jgi:hypothetical protein
MNRDPTIIAAARLGRSAPDPDRIEGLVLSEFFNMGVRVGDLKRQDNKLIDLSGEKVERFGTLQNTAGKDNANEFPDFRFRPL